MLVFRKKYKRYSNKKEFSRASKVMAVMTTFLLKTSVFQVYGMENPIGGFSSAYDLQAGQVKTIDPFDALLAQLPIKSADEMIKDMASMVEENQGMFEVYKEVCKDFTHDQLRILHAFSNTPFMMSFTKDLLKVDFNRLDYLKYGISHFNSPAKMITKIPLLTKLQDSHNKLKESFDSYEPNIFHYVFSQCDSYEKRVGEWHVIISDLINEYVNLNDSVNEAQEILMTMFERSSVFSAEILMKDFCKYIPTVHEGNCPENLSHLPIHKEGFIRLNNPEVFAFRQNKAKVYKELIVEHLKQYLTLGGEKKRDVIQEIINKALDDLDKIATKNQRSKCSYEERVGICRAIVADIPKQYLDKKYEENKEAILKIVNEALNDLDMFTAKGGQFNLGMFTEKNEHRLNNMKQFMHFLKIKESAEKNEEYGIDSFVLIMHNLKIELKNVLGDELFDSYFDPLKIYLGISNFDNTIGIMRHLSKDLSNVLEPNILNSKLDPLAIYSNQMAILDRKIRKAEIMSEMLDLGIMYFIKGPIRMQKSSVHILEEATDDITKNLCQALGVESLNPKLDPSVLFMNPQLHASAEHYLNSEHFLLFDLMATWDGILPDDVWSQIIKSEYPDKIRFQEFTKSQKENILYQSSNKMYSDLFEKHPQAVALYNDFMNKYEPLFLSFDKQLGEATTARTSSFVETLLEKQRENAEGS